MYDVSFEMGEEGVALGPKGLCYPAHPSGIHPLGPPVLDRKLLDLLVCPVSRGPLIPDESRQELLSLASGLAYPVRDGMPVLLEDQARTLTGEEIERWRNAKR